MTITTPFDDLMKRALGDDDLWAQMTAQPADLARARTWLLDTIAGIDHQLAHNRDSLQEASIVEDAEEIRDRELRFYRWRRRAMHLKHLCAKRNRQLNERRSQEASREQEFKALLVDLADTVRDHQHGRATDQELHAELDDLHLPGQPPVNLRQYLAALDAQEKESA